MEPDADKEFEFYMKFAKPFVLNLTDAKERVKAAYWLQMLRTVTDPDMQRLRCDYLKLLLFVLQRHRLIGIFAETPDTGTSLRPFPDDLTVLGMAKRMIDDDNLEKTKPPSHCGDPGNYMVSVSPNLQEYAVVQEIHKFGSHCFYAVSGDPITEWENPHKGYFKKRPEHLEQSFFDTTTPSMYIIDNNASSTGLSEKSERPMTPKSNKSFTGVDDSKWLEKEGSKSAMDDDYDPMEGKVEIEKHFCSMNRTLKQLKNHTFLSGGISPNIGEAAPSTANEFNQTVNDLFGGTFRGTIATNKLVRNIDTSDGYGTQMTRSEIIQGHTLVEQDPYDNSINQLHKSMGIQDESSSRVNIGGGRSSGSDTSLQNEKVNFDRLMKNRRENSLPLSKKSSSGKSGARNKGSGSPNERRTLTRHLEPAPGETIDVVTTDDGPTSITSYRHKAPGIDDTVDIITTTSRSSDNRNQSAPISSSSSPKTPRIPKEHLSFTNREPTQRQSGRRSLSKYADIDEGYGALNPGFIEEDNCIRSHYEPSPGETIDIIVNDDGPTSQASYHHTAPGIDEIINIISTNPDANYNEPGSSRGNNTGASRNRAEILRMRLAEHDNIIKRKQKSLRPDREGQHPNNEWRSKVLTDYGSGNPSHRSVSKTGGKYNQQPTSSVTSITSDERDPSFQQSTPSGSRRTSSSRQNSASRQNSNFLMQRQSGSNSRSANLRTASRSAAKSEDDDDEICRCPTAPYN